MDLIPSYVERRHGREKIEYLHPILEPILKETYGIIVYQEQVMQIAQEMAGYSLGKADLLRRAMGKKIRQEMATQREIFMAGAVERGVDRDKAGEIFDLMEKFADYGFNKSHAAAYALVAYQTAYLKAHHFREFMAANLTLDVNNTDKISQHIAECRKKGVAVLSPDINESSFEFVVTDDGIRFGLGAIKNLGMGLASRKGKLRMHSSVKPSIKAEACTFCGQCIRWCPEDAIVPRDGRAFIVQERCIGCGECLAVCRFDAVMYDWRTESAELQRRTAEHAFGAVIGKKGKLYCLNFLTDMTRDCDCLAQKQEPLLPDLGILASRDPVAVDQATLDLTRERFGRHLGEASYPELDSGIQIEHGERIGMGSRKYRLVPV